MQSRLTVAVNSKGTLILSVLRVFPYSISECSHNQEIFAQYNKGEVGVFLPLNFKR